MENGQIFIVWEKYSRLYRVAASSKQVSLLLKEWRL